jgi:4-nitrophenyl phosphatase
VRQSSALVLTLHSLLLATTVAHPRCRDATYPSADGFVMPGAGMGIGALKATLGREPDVVAGKPSQEFLASVLAAKGLEPATTLMVGDRLNTDIVFGNAGGLETLLVLTGVTTLEEAESSKDPLERPSYVTDCFADLLEAARSLAAAE